MDMCSNHVQQRVKVRTQGGRVTFVDIYNSKESERRAKASQGWCFLEWEAVSVNLFSRREKVGAGLFRRCGHLMPILIQRFLVCVSTRSTAQKQGKVLACFFFPFSKLF